MLQSAPSPSVDERNDKILSPVVANHQTLIRKLEELLIQEALT